MTITAINSEEFSPEALAATIQDSKKYRAMVSGLESTTASINCTIAQALDEGFPDNELLVNNLRRTLLAHTMLFLQHFMSSSIDRGVTLAYIQQEKGMPQVIITALDDDGPLPEVAETPPLVTLT